MPFKSVIGGLWIRQGMGARKCHLGRTPIAKRRSDGLPSDDNDDTHEGGINETATNVDPSNRDGGIVSDVGSSGSYANGLGPSLGSL